MRPLPVAIVRRRQNQLESIGASERDRCRKGRLLAEPGVMKR